MLEQFRAAAAGARNSAALDSIARLLWKALAEGCLAEADAEAVSEAVEGRRRELATRAALSQAKPVSGRRRPVSPDRAKSIARRRQLAASGAMPGHLAAAFTQGEVAALAVIAREVRRRGRCELCIDAIAAMSGVSRTTVQGALRQARRLGLLRVQERRRAGQRSLSNMVEVISAEWRAWLRLGGGFKKPNTTENKILVPEHVDKAARLRRTGDVYDMFQPSSVSSEPIRARTRDTFG
jgi:hypothetical protein